MILAITREVVALANASDSDDEATVSPAPQLLVLVLYEAVPQTTKKSLSSVSTTSGSVEVDLKSKVPDGSTGPSLLNPVNEGRRFTLNGDELVALVPCEKVVLQRGLTGSSSHTQANQALDSEKRPTSSVVVAALASVPLGVPVDTAQRVPALQIGARVPKVEVDC